MGPDEVSGLHLGSPGRTVAHVAADSGHFPELTRDRQTWAPSHVAGAARSRGRTWSWAAERPWSPEWLLFAPAVLGVSARARRAPSRNVLENGDPLRAERQEASHSKPSHHPPPSIAERETEAGRGLALGDRDHSQESPRGLPGTQPAPVLSQYALQTLLAVPTPLTRAVPPETWGVSRRAAQTSLPSPDRLPPRL